MGPLQMGNHKCTCKRQASSSMATQKAVTLTRIIMCQPPKTGMSFSYVKPIGMTEWIVLKYLCLKIRRSHFGPEIVSNTKGKQMGS
jgi:hypothetical protein